MNYLKPTNMLFPMKSKSIMKKQRMIIILILLISFLFSCEKSLPSKSPTESNDIAKRALGVCPPFPLRDEQGQAINPVKGANDAVPYSPRQTCGTSGCHDYNKITEGFHFAQGKGEKIPDIMSARYNWVTSPGNYGGNWCSPAPLYRQLAPKRNSNPRLIDMTSFDFVTATCGACHPGGGPLELDREGKRYDLWMSDPASGFTSGADNGFDGDYYKARWAETGVIEADCLLCHMPEYDFKKRNAELANLNFRWAATAGAGFAAIKGKVSANEQPIVSYDKSKFDAEGNLIVHIAPEPRNETCLNCHFKPDWKKRGSSYSARADVHMMAGLRCVDCHAAGSKAADPRIKGKELHQFGKGDDPSGWARNDLDNTVRSCEDCHLKGWRNAPLARHDWLPPLHMESLSCQACHIPTRAVKSALVQASDAYNPAPRISPPPKHIWTFYDQEMNFWNHYGELELFTGKDAPTNITRPTLIRYKGKIFPANRVHSAWVGYEEEGKPGLNQLFMKDFFQMWTQHRADPANKYPELAKIADDNKDGIIEVNRPEEIDALLAATKAYLVATKFPLDGKRLVWVSDSRAYYSSTESKELPHESHEATAYASVYKFSHDVSPARAAYGAGGCLDCHRQDSPFFAAATLKRPFGSNGMPVWMPNQAILGFSSFYTALGIFREGVLKPLIYAGLALLTLLLASMALRFSLERALGWNARTAYAFSILFLAGGFGASIWALLFPGLPEYMTVSRFRLDSNHFAVAMLALTLSLGITLIPQVSGWTRYLRRIIWLVAAITAAFGGLMLAKLNFLSAINRVSYSGFDFALAVLILLAAAYLSAMIFNRPKECEK